MLPGRSSLGCICCSSNNFLKEYALVSPFFSERALNHGAAFVVDMLLCKKCGTRFYDVDITDAQLSRLYDGYRGENYYSQRHRYEPWYTKAINDNVGGEEEFVSRRRSCLEALAAASVENKFSSVLDHGGDKGQMLSGGAINAERRAVYEISGVTTEPGIESITRDQMYRSTWDMVLSCHVLEHLSNPSDYVEELAELGHKGTVYYFEVPNEGYVCSFFNRTLSQKIWLNWLTSHLTLLKAFHFISVAFRTKLKIVLPLLFPALNEHLNYFSVQGINELLATKGLEVKYSGVGSSGHIIAVAIKK